MKTFHSNCTLPTEPSFVTSPNVRGTLNIVWSCLSVLILCTWSIQHPNLPLQVRDQTFGQMVRFQWHQTKKKVFYMVLAVLVPEYFVLVAMAELLAAHRYTKVFQKLAEGTGVKWTITHTFFANMGGFQIKFDKSLVINTTEGEQGRTSSLSSATGEQRTFRAAPVSAAPLFSRDRGDTSEALLNVGKEDPVPPALKRAVAFGNISWEPLFQDLVRDYIKGYAQGEQDYREKTYWEIVEAACFFQGNIWTTDAAQLITACHQGLVDLPVITEEELKDKSKSDVMVKILAIVQGSWLVIQIISRAAWNPPLPSSQLEIGTVAIASCMLFVYGLLWYKPQNVSTAMNIVAKRAPLEADVEEIVHASDHFRRRKDFVVPWGKNKYTDGTNGFWDGVSGDTLVGFAAGTVMGVIHFSAWNFSFPTHVESLLWKVMAGVTAGLPVILFLVLSMLVLVNSSDMAASSVFMIMGICYILARLFIVVEMFRCLYFMPQGGYIATWASEVPSIG